MQTQQNRFADFHDVDNLCVGYFAYRKRCRYFNSHALDNREIVGWNFACAQVTIY